MDDTVKDVLWYTSDNPNHGQIIMDGHEEKCMKMDLWRFGGIDIRDGGFPLLRETYAFFANRKSYNKQRRGLKHVIIL